MLRPSTTISEDFYNDSPVLAREALARLRAGLASDEMHSGWPIGVVGAFDTDQKVLFGYPEIAGYWLRWGSEKSYVSDHVGSAVVRWLSERGSAREGWPTRVPTILQSLDSHYSKAQYLFDHIMLWDGAQRWGMARSDASALSLAESVRHFLDDFGKSGHILQDPPVVGHGCLPQRWSGQFGPFTLKLAARLMEQDGLLAERWRRAIPSLISLALEAPHKEAHPQLYAIEGMLELGCVDEAREALRLLFQAHGGPAGLREAEGCGPRRSDVLAQALRALCLCQMVTDWSEEAEELAGELARLVDAHGLVRFSTKPDDPCSPTWVALFAEQALSAWLCEPLSARNVV